MIPSRAQLNRDDLLPTLTHGIDHRSSTFRESDYGFSYQSLGQYLQHHHLHAIQDCILHHSYQASNNETHNINTAPPGSRTIDPTSLLKKRWPHTQQPVISHNSYFEIAIHQALLQQRHEQTVSALFSSHLSHATKMQAALTAGQPYYIRSNSDLCKQDGADITVSKLLEYSLFSPLTTISTTPLGHRPRNTGLLLVDEPSGDPKLILPQSSLPTSQKSFQPR